MSSPTPSPNLWLMEPLIVLVRTVKIRDQVEQRCTVKIREFCFDIGPRGVQL
jgi:hypothetical protein